jgi:hypothetical protein
MGCSPPHDYGPCSRPLPRSNSSPHQHGRRRSSVASPAPPRRRRLTHQHPSTPRSRLKSPTPTGAEVHLHVSGGSLLSPPPPAVRLRPSRPDADQKLQSSSELNVRTGVAVQSLCRQSATTSTSTSSRSCPSVSADDVPPPCPSPPATLVS